MKIAKFVLPVLAVGIAATSASAGLSNAVVDQVLVPNVVANAINWDGGGTNDWTSAALLINLDSGSVYNDAVNGTDVAPSPILLGFLPALAFDTHVGIIGDTTGGIAGGAGDLGDLSGLSMAGQKVNVSWSNTAQTNTGIAQIAMITLSTDAQGTWSYLSQQVRTDGFVVNGEMVAIPEPASLALLGLGGLAVLRRR